jgi:hypothetical protein
VNPRKYQISGGVFKLMCVEKPVQPIELGKNFLMTTSMLLVNLNQLLKLYFFLVKSPKKIKYKNFYQSYEPNPLALETGATGQFGSAVSFGDVETMRRKSLFVFNPAAIPVPQETEELDPEKAAAYKENEEKLEQLIHVNMILPDNVFWWEQPVVCCWEPWADSLEFHALDPVMQDYQLHYEKYEQKRLVQLFSAPPIPLNRQQLTTLEDFTLSDLPKNLDLYNLICTHILPRLPANHKFQVELLAEIEKMNKLKKKQEQLEREATAEMDLKDSLNTEVNRSSDLSKLPRAVKRKVAPSQLLSIPRNLFPTPTFIPRLQITNRKLSGEAIDDSAEEASVAFSNFMQNLIPLRDTEKPYFRNYSKIALYQEEEDVEDEIETLASNEESHIVSTANLKESGRRVTGAMDGLGSKLLQEKEISNFSNVAEHEYVKYCYSQVLMDFIDSSLADLKKIELS